MIKKISDLDDKKKDNDNAIFDAVQNVAKGIENISKRQLEFENKTTEAYNKLAQRVIDLGNERASSNPPANAVAPAGELKEVGSVDKDGINWGHDEFSGQQTTKTLKPWF